MLFSKKLLLQEQVRFQDTLFTEPGEHALKIPAGNYEVVCRGGGGASGSGAGAKGEIKTARFTADKNTNVTVVVGEMGLTYDNGGNGGQSETRNGGNYTHGGGGGKPSYISRLQKTTKPSEEVYYEMFTGGLFWSDSAFTFCFSSLEPKPGDVLMTSTYLYEPMLEQYGTVISYDGTNLTVRKIDGSTSVLQKLSIPAEYQRPYARYYVKDKTLTQGMLVYDSNFRPVDRLYITTYEFLSQPRTVYSVGLLTNQIEPCYSKNLLSAPLTRITIEKPAGEELIVSANGGGGGGGTPGNAYSGGRYTGGGGSGGGGGYYRFIPETMMVQSVPGKNGVSAQTSDMNGFSGTTGNTADFPEIYSGSGGWAISDSHAKAGGAGARGGGASGGGGGNAGNHSGGVGGAGAGGAGGSLDASCGASGWGGGSGLTMGYNYHTAPTDTIEENATYGVTGDYGMGGAGKTGGENGKAGFVFLKRV